MSDSKTKPVKTIGDDASDTKVTLVTKEGLKKLQEELTYLKDVRRKEIAGRIKEAISYGDLSENSEYEDAKNEQAFVEGRLAEIEEQIKYAKIITEHHHTAVVQLGSRVAIQGAKDEEEYVIVGSTEADPLAGKISNESPVGKALLGKQVGDAVKVHAPSGVLHYKISRID